MTKSAEPTFDEMYPSEVTRKGIRFHMASAVWDYGRRNMLPLWTDFVHCPIVLPAGYKFSDVRSEYGVRIHPGGADGD